MKHHRSTRKLGRERGQRKALLKSLARSLVLRGKITTTEAKAKEIRPMVEKLTTKAKNPTLANHRALIAVVGEVPAKKLIQVAAGYTDRKGGYLRITKMGPRKGDAAQLALIEFV